MSRTFLVALTGDFYNDDGAAQFKDFGLSVFDDEPAIAYRPCTGFTRELEPEQVGEANGVVVLGAKVTARSLAQSHDLLALARFGVGYDGVDVAACTAADVLLTIAVGAVDRPVAEATIGWMIALSHQMTLKDRLVREGRWAERPQHIGRELRDRTLGVVGLGNIGRALVELLRGFGMARILAFDPFVQPAAAQALGVTLVGLDELLASADFVTIHCPLNDATRNLLGPRELALMKPDAYLLNLARGGIVDEDALFDVLSQRRIAGAAIDCFVGEPLTAPPRFSQLDNVLLAPHSIAWTDELLRDIGRTACRGMIDLAHGRRPKGAVNPEVFDRPGFQEKWKRLRV